MHINLINKTKMKKQYIIIISLILLGLYSCKHEVKNPEIPVECINVKVKVVDQNHDNIKNCNVLLKLEGKNTGRKTELIWDLPNTGDTSVCVKTIQNKAYLSIIGDSAHVNIDYVIEGGLNESTNFIFVTDGCKLTKVEKSN